MKKLKIYRLFSLFIALPMLTSCFEDKGNYDYKPIGEAVVTIPGVSENEDRYVSEQFAVLNLDPEIKYEGGTTEADYEFQWLKYPQHISPDADGNYPEPEVIATTKKLSYTVNDNPNEFWMVLKVKNRLTEVVSDYRFQFIVTSVNGLIILDESGNGEGDLHILRDADITLDMPTGKEGVTRNYFSEKNGGIKLQDARSIGYCPHNEGKALFVFRNNGVYWSDPGTYVLVPDVSYNQLFSAAPGTAKPQRQLYNNLNGGLDVLIDDGTVYSIFWRMMGWGRRLYNKQTLTAGGDYKVAPLIAPITVSTSNYSFVMYDESAHRFITMNLYGNMAAPSSEGKFDTGNLDPELQVEAMGEGIDGSTCAIFRKSGSEQGDEVYMYQTSFTEDTPIPLEKIDLSSFAGIQEASAYAFGTRGSFMYYASGAKVYCFRFSKTEPTEFYTVGEGETVTHMQVYANPDNMDYNGKILFIATEKAGTGKIYKIKFNEMTGLRESDAEVYDGFGVIKDMFYKQ